MKDWKKEINDLIDTEELYTDLSIYGLSKLRVKLYAFIEQVEKEAKIEIIKSLITRFRYYEELGKFLLELDETNDLISELEERRDLIKL